MKRPFISFLLTLPLWLSVAACSGEEDIPTPDPMPVPADSAEHVVLVYMEAQNSLWSDAYSDLEEIEAARKDIPSDCRVAVFLDGFTQGGCIQTPRLLTYTSKESKEVLTYPSQMNSADSATMVAVLDRMARLFPARKYSLVLWSHGTGWVPAKKTRTRSFGSDNGMEMDIPVLRGVLEQLPRLNLQYILFDACFMQSIEVAYELRDVTRWVIGSPAEIPGKGAPYDLAMKNLCKADAEGIVQDYHRGYKDPYGAPLSAICTNRLEMLAKATASVLPACFAERSTPSCEGVQRYDGRIGRTEMYGMKSAMYHLLDEETYAHWAEVFDWAVPVQSPVGSWITLNSDYPPAKLTDPEHYGGVSIFLPSSRYDSKGYNTFFQTYQWYEAAGWKGTGW